ncbi:MAG: GNAT family N-acetyltransferase [Burkholderiales bacterium]|nr:GNAT family N-acetyltransferase [Anaerolineae bacterium]
MTTTFLIRDALESDLEACAGIDHRYETDYVWQMSVAETTGERQVMFKTERLPRTMEVAYPCDSDRLSLSLADDECFLVAVTRTVMLPTPRGEDDIEDEYDDEHLDTAVTEETVLGYLTMRRDTLHHSALVHEIVVARGLRRHRIATRLLKAARRWAQEYDLLQMTIETQTKNYPAILFCQQAGFTFCGFNDHYFPNQDIALFFSQSLR